MLRVLEYYQMTVFYIIHPFGEWIYFVYYIHSVNECILYNAFIRCITYTLPVPETETVMLNKMSENRVYLIDWLIDKLKACSWGSCNSHA